MILIFRKNLIKKKKKNKWFPNIPKILFENIIVCKNLFRIEFKTINIYLINDIFLAIKSIQAIEISFLIISQI